MSAELFTALLCSLLGLAVGSFLNVVVWRVPRGESVVSPPSACPACGDPIRARDNVPVLSWLLLGRRCRRCREPISARYPLVELGTATLFGLVGLHLGLSWQTPAFLYGAAIGVALTLIDLDTHRLPDAIVLPSYLVVAVLLTVAAWGTGDWAALLRSSLGALVLGLFYAVIWFVYPAGMGLGDVKLAPVVGAYLGWVGWGAVVVGGFGAFLLGGLLSIALLALGKVDRKSGLPFGPWMIVAAAAAVVVGQPLWDLYVGTFT